MAIKLALAAALLVGLVALTGATTYTTTVTTTEDENQGGMLCWLPLQGRQFHACQSVLADAAQSSDEQRSYKSSEERQHERDCCSSLQEMERMGITSCACEAIEKAMSQVQERGAFGRSGKVYKKAVDLPRICSLKRKSCQFNAIFL